MDEMLVRAYGVIKVMTLHEESIRLRMSSPTATHVRAYIAVMDGESSGMQHPTPDREEGLNYPPVAPTQVGGPHIHCK